MNVFFLSESATYFETKTDYHAPTTADKFDQDEKIRILSLLIESEFNLFEVAKKAKENTAYPLATAMHDLRARLLVERYKLLKENGHLIRLLPQKVQGYLDVINAKAEEVDK